MLTVVAPAAITASSSRHRKSGSDRPASSGENSTLSVYSRAQPTAFTACSSTCAGVMRSFICMWMRRARDERMDAHRLRAGLSASAARRMSFSFARASAHTVLSVIAFAMSCTASKSPFDDAGKPASMTSTRSRSSWRAMRASRRASSTRRAICSPSRSVVSKMIRWSDMVLLDLQAAPRRALRECKRTLRTAAIHRRRRPPSAWR